MKNILSDQEIYDRFGQPNDWTNFVKFYPTYQIYLAWDPAVKVNYFYCHKLIVPGLDQAFTHISDCYSESGIRELRLDQYGGCFNYRLMRGSSTKLSRHSWAIAIDLDPAHNKLRWKANGIAPEPSLAHETLKPVIDIFYDAGFVNYGVEKGYDWMHFEASRAMFPS